MKKKKLLHKNNNNNLKVIILVAARSSRSNATKVVVTIRPPSTDRHKWYMTNSARKATTLSRANWPLPLLSTTTTKLLLINNQQPSLKQAPLADQYFHHLPYFRCPHSATCSRLVACSITSHNTRTPTSLSITSAPVNDMPTTTQTGHQIHFPLLPLCCRQPFMSPYLSSFAVTLHSSLSFDLVLATLTNHCLFPLHNDWYLCRCACVETACPNKLLSTSFCSAFCRLCLQRNNVTL